VRWAAAVPPAQAHLEYPSPKPWVRLIGLEPGTVVDVNRYLGSINSGRNAAAPVSVRVPSTGREPAHPSGSAALSPLGRVVEDDRVTVVIASRNRRTDLMQTLVHHRAVTMLIDNDSSDGTAAAAHAAFPDLSVIALPRNVGAFGRTIGARAAHTEYIAFADDDSWWAPGSLRAAADILASHPAVAAVVARILVGPHERVDPISTVMARSPLPRASSGHPALLGFVACATMVRRSAFLDVGGFDRVVRFPGEEERVALDLTDRGQQIVYADDLTVHHHPSPRRHGPDARISSVTRSSILTAVMRLPRTVVADRIRHAWHWSAATRRGARAAGRDLLPALRERHVVTPPVLQAIAALADQSAT
jgi:GT2 family glycosyltransferase